MIQTAADRGGSAERRQSDGRTAKTRSDNNASRLSLSHTVPSCGPTNVSAFATTSSSILVRWFEVPEPDRNGLILGYRVCFHVSRCFFTYKPHQSKMLEMHESLLLSSSPRFLRQSGGVQREGLRRSRPLLDRGGKRHPQRPADRPRQVCALRDPGPGLHKDGRRPAQFSAHTGEDFGRCAGTSSGHLVPRSADHLSPAYLAVPRAAQRDHTWSVYT